MEPPGGGPGTVVYIGRTRSAEKRQQEERERRQAEEERLAVSRRRRQVKPVEEKGPHDGFSKLSSAAAVTGRRVQMEGMIREISVSGDRARLKGFSIDVGAVAETRLGKMAVHGATWLNPEVKSEEDGDKGAPFASGRRRPSAEMGSMARGGDNGKDEMEAVKPSNPLDDWGKFSAGTEKECHLCLTTHSHVWHSHPKPNGHNVTCNACYIRMHPQICPFCGEDSPEDDSKLLCPSCKRQTHADCELSFRGAHHAMDLCIVCEMQARIERSDVSLRYRDLMVHQMPTVLNHHIFQFDAFFGTESTAVPKNTERLFALQQQTPVSPPNHSQANGMEEWEGPPANSARVGWGDAVFAPAAEVAQGQDGGASVLNSSSSSSLASSLIRERIVNAAPRVMCWRAPDIRRRIGQKLRVARQEREDGDSSVLRRGCDGGNTSMASRGGSRADLSDGRGGWGSSEESLESQLAMWKQAQTRAHLQILHPSRTPSLQLRLPIPSRVGTAASAATTHFRPQTGATTARPYTGSSGAPAGAPGSRPYTGAGVSRPFTRELAHRPMTGATPNPQPPSGSQTARPYTSSRPPTSHTSSYTRPPTSHAQWGVGGSQSRPHTRGFCEGGASRPNTRGLPGGAKGMLGGGGNAFLPPWPSAPTSNPQDSSRGRDGAFRGVGGRPQTVHASMGGHGESPRGRRITGGGGRRADSPGGKRPQAQPKPGGRGMQGVGGGGGGADKSYDGIMKHITVDMELYGKGILDLVPSFLDKPAQDFLQCLISNGIYVEDAGSDVDGNRGDPYGVASQFEPHKEGLQRVARACTHKFFPFHETLYGKLPRPQACLVILRAFGVYPALIGTKDVLSIIHEGMSCMIDGAPSAEQDLLYAEIKEVISRCAFHVFRTDPLKLGLGLAVPPDSSDKHVVRVLLEFMGANRSERVEEFESMFVTAEDVDGMKNHLSKLESRRIETARDFKGHNTDPRVQVEARFKGILQDVFFFFATKRQVANPGTKYGGGTRRELARARKVVTPGQMREEVKSKLHLLSEEARVVRERRYEKDREERGSRAARPISLDAPPSHAEGAEGTELHGGGAAGGGVRSRFTHRVMLQERLEDKVALGKIDKKEIPYLLDLLTQSAEPVKKEKGRGGKKSEDEMAKEAKKLALFRSMDCQQDNMVDYGEFVAFYKGDEKKARHFWFMLAHTEEDKIMWGDFNSNPASDLIKAPTTMDVAAIEELIPQREPKASKNPKRLRRRSQVWSAAVSEGFSLSQKALAAVAGGGLGTAPRAPSSGASQPHRAHHHHLGADAGREADFEWVEVEDSLDVLFPTRAPDARIEGVGRIGPPRSMHIGEHGQNLDVVVELRKMLRLAIRDSARGGSFCEANDDECLQALARRGREHVKQGKELEEGGGLDEGALSDAVRGTPRPKVIRTPRRTEQSHEDVSSHLQGWGGIGTGSDEFWAMDESEVFRMCQALNILGTSEEVQAATKLCDDSKLLELINTHSTQDPNGPKGGIPSRLMEWEAFSGFFHDLALECVTEKHIKGGQFDPSQAGRLAGLFHFLAVPSPKHAALNGGWVRDRAIQWARIFYLPQVSDDPVVTSHCRWIQDMLPPSNEPWRGDDRALHLHNDVAPLPDNTIQPLIGSNYPRDVEYKAATGDAVIKNEGDEQDEGGQDRSGAGGHDALRWWAILVHDSSDPTHDVARRSFQRVAWKLIFRCFGLDVGKLPEGKAATILGGKPEVPCVRLYSSDGKYRERHGLATLGDAMRLSAWVESCEDCSVPETLSHDPTPLARFLEVPDGIRPYLDTLHTLNTRAQQQGFKPSEALKGIILQLLGPSLHVSNTQVSTVQALAIAQAIAHSRRLRSVVIDHCRLTDEGIEAIIIALSVNPHVRHISLAGAATYPQTFDVNGQVQTLAEPSRQGTEALAELLRFHRHLKILCVKGFNLDDKGGSMVAKSLSANTRIPLERLDLSNNRLTDRVATELATSFASLRDAQLARKSEGVLTEIDLSGNVFTTSGAHPFQNIPSSSIVDSGTVQGVEGATAVAGKGRVLEGANLAITLGVGAGGKSPRKFPQESKGGGGKGSKGAGRGGQGPGRTPSAQILRIGSAASAAPPHGSPPNAIEPIIDGGAASRDALLAEMDAGRVDAVVGYRIMASCIAGTLLSEGAAWELMLRFADTPMCVSAAEALYCRLASSRYKESFSERLEKHLAGRKRFCNSTMRLGTGNSTIRLGSGAEVSRVVSGGAAGGVREELLLGSNRFGISKS